MEYNGLAVIGVFLKVTHTHTHAQLQNVQRTHSASSLHKLYF